MILGMHRQNIKFKHHMGVDCYISSSSSNRSGLLANLHSLQSNESSIQPYESCLQSNFTGSIFAYLSCVQLLPNKLRLLLYPVPADSLSVNVVIKTVILWQRYMLPGQELSPPPPLSCWGRSTKPREGP